MKDKNWKQSWSNNNYNYFDYEVVVGTLSAACGTRTYSFKKPKAKQPHVHIEEGFMKNRL